MVLWWKRGRKKFQQPLAFQSLGGVVPLSPASPLVAAAAASSTARGEFRRKYRETHVLFFSISSMLLSSFSTVIVPRSGKGRPPPPRRSTLDDKNALTCIKNGDLTKDAEISSGEVSSGESTCTAVLCSVFCAL